MESGEAPKQGVKERISQLTEEAANRSRQDALKRDTLRKITYLERKAVIEYHEVYNLVREFFKGYLHKPVEFTMNELKQELKQTYISSQTRAQIIDLLSRLETIEYATVHYSRQDLIGILQLFETVVRDLVKSQAAQTGWRAKLRAFLFKEQPIEQTYLSDLPVIEATDAPHVRISVLVEHIYLALEKKSIRRAKHAYKEILEFYNTLDDTQKQRHYPLVEQTYMDIVHKAEELEKKN